MIDALTKGIEDRTATIAVIGCGYVGLPLAMAYADAGFHVLGVDVDARRVAQLAKGDSYIRDVSSATLRQHLRERRFEATTDYERLRDAEIIFVSVPTPSDRSKQPDLRYVIAAAEGVASKLRRGQLVILESTTYPGTTDEVMRPILERSGLKAGVDFFLAFSPERIDPGNKTYGIENTPKVVGGVDPQSTALAAAALQVVTKGRVHVVSGARAAELTKLLENTFRAVNIALVNELAMLCDRMGIDIWEVVEAAATKPYGFMPFYPGPGVGGHCLAPGTNVYARDERGAGPRDIAALWESCAERREPATVDGVEVVEAPGFATLGIGVDGPPRWERATHIFRRRYRGDLITVSTDDGRRIVVTDRHPMLVAAGAIVVRDARDVRSGDLLPVLVERIPGADDDPVVDLIPHLSVAQCAKTRVRIIGGHWSAHAGLLRDRFGPSAAHDWVRGDYVPLERYLEIEDVSGVPRRDEVDLWTGRGPAQSRLPAVIRLTPEIARLVGYYATEGCISRDAKALRVRFTFHAAEHETVADVRSILDRLGVRSSVSRDRLWANVHIKVSSALFAIFLRDALRCGVNSYDAAVPDALLGAAETHRTELLTGLLRGDGSVYATSGMRRYRKGDRSYEHQNTSASLSFWTSSARLEDQFLYLLQTLGLRSSIQRRARQSGADVHILGREAVQRLAPLFADAKRARIDACFAAKQRWPRSRGTHVAAGQSVVAVRDVAAAPADTYVYSIETETTHTFAAAQGIFVHNCIPIDPYYLSWKAREYDFHTKFIELAAETNLAMPFFTVGRIRKQLNDAGISLHGAKVLVLGAAFKRDIDDARESAAIRVMEILTQEGAVLEYHDPFVSEVRLATPIFGPNGAHQTLRSVSLDDARLRAADAVVILVAHSAVDYGRVARSAARVFDAVNATRGIDADGRIERL